MLGLPCATDGSVQSINAVEFNAERNEFSVPADWLAIKNPEFDEDAWRNAIARCETRATKRASPPTVVDHVRTRLECGIHDGGLPPSLGELALELSLSTRSVIRHLNRAGTSYHQLLDELRRQRAKILLNDAEVRVSDVAAALGYEDPANFGRAFRRWFGTAPGRYRNERH